MSISAKIIADSISATGDRITTFELEYPRFVHSELMTHRMLSKNAASSRAIPFKANVQNILTDTATPIHWGLNQPGMVADKEADVDLAKLALGLWNEARDSAIINATKLNDLGIHKQVVNRILEPFVVMKVVVTGTEWDNFFWLRHHKDAQPEIAELARVMLEKYNESKPELLNVKSWHTPYVKHGKCPMTGCITYLDDNDNELTLENARIISASCCAQVSYRKNDDSLEKAQKVFDMLNLIDDSETRRKHSSPIEHIATPILFEPEIGGDFEFNHGITHQRSDGTLWSGNFKGWVQWRQLFKGESCSNHPEILKM